MVGQVQAAYHRLSLWPCAAGLVRPGSAPDSACAEKDHASYKRNRDARGRERPTSSCSSHDLAR